MTPDPVWPKGVDPHLVRACNCDYCRAPVDGFLVVDESNQTTLPIPGRGDES